MPAAARLGDPTSHGPPLLGAGSPNVLIGGKPAWRITDFHTCPLFDGKSPHGGGLVSVGCPKVLINNVPAAKMGDMVMEAAGPPNPITAGEPTVLICEGAGGVGGMTSKAASGGMPSAVQSGPGYEDSAEEESKPGQQKDEMSYIKGQVVDDATGEAIEGIPVLILGDDGRRYQTKTDDQGFYEVLNVRKGKYEITIDLEGQEDVKTEVQV